MASFPPVTVYSLASCPACQQAKAFLRSKGVPYEEKDYADEAVQAEMKERGLPTGSVPVIVIGTAVVKGFSRPGINAALTATCGGPKPVTQKSLDEDVALDPRGLIGAAARDPGGAGAALAVGLVVGGALVYLGSRR